MAVAKSRAVWGQEHGPWWTWSTIDEDWGGYRDSLADRGLAFSGTTVVDLQGNVSGARDRPLYLPMPLCSRLIPIWRSSPVSKDCSFTPNSLRMLVRIFDGEP
jgi:hypothetical protein